jgi:hypothetical protein
MADSASTSPNAEPYNYTIEAGRYHSFHDTDHSSFDLYIDQQRMAGEIKHIHAALRRGLSDEENKLLLARIDKLDDHCYALEECTDHFTLQYEDLMDHVRGHYIWPDFLQREWRLSDYVQTGMLIMQDALANFRTCLEGRIEQAKKEEMI